jgi:hypothetical protein
MKSKTERLKPSPLVYFKASHVFEYSRTNMLGYLSFFINVYNTFLHKLYSSVFDCTCCPICRVFIIFLAKYRFEERKSKG